jgi:hypothetical protein
MSDDPGAYRIYPTIYSLAAVHNIFAFEAGGNKGEQPMRSDEYHRLYEACLEMAQQSKAPALQARWLRMAQTWFSRARDARSMQPKMGRQTGCSVTILQANPVRRRRAVESSPVPVSVVIH